MSRKKGSKSKSGIPIKGLNEAIQLVKMIYDNVGEKSMSFQEMAEFMKLPKGVSTPIAGALKEYELIEKSDLGWRVSELGKNAIFSDIEAVKQAFTKNSIFSDLYNRFGDKEITQGIIETYIRDHYKKGESIGLIVNRFFEGLNYIKGLQSIKPHTTSNKSESIILPTIKIIKLKYALNPVKVEEIVSLVNEVAEDLKNYDDVSIKILSEKLKQNIKDINSLKLLINSIVDILAEKYPNLAISDKREKSPEKTKQE